MDESAGEPSSKDACPGLTVSTSGASDACQDADLTPKQEVKPDASPVTSDDAVGHAGQKRPSPARSSPRGAGGRSTPRKKKPTYMVRKEEKASLLKELDALEAQLKRVREQAAQSTANAERQHTALLERLSQDYLHGAVQQQKLSLVNVQSALSGFLSVQHHVPFETPIYLSSNPLERRDTLTALKPHKLRTAQRYITERTRFIDCSRSFAEHSRFVAPNGDFCELEFDITPYEGVSSVRRVYDALLHYFSFMDICVTDIIGDVTIREDDDSAGKGISQNRLVSTLTNGVQLEMNSVMYSEFRERDDEFGDGGDYAILTADYVDKDERFPYNSGERVRYDVTAVLTLKTEKLRTKNAAGEVEEEAVVVLTRTCLVKIRHDEVELPHERLHELRENLGRWSAAMLQAVRQAVYR